MIAILLLALMAAIAYTARNQRAALDAERAERLRMSRYLSAHGHEAAYRQWRTAHH